MVDETLTLVRDGGVLTFTNGTRNVCVRPTPEVERDPRFAVRIARAFGAEVSAEQVARLLLDASKEPHIG